MPLDLTTRAITLWSNPGDTVLSPFMGIGSEGFCAMKLKRKFLGVELKDSYFRQACRNIGAAEKSAESLFDYEAA
jgi:DNA modification methylase